MPPKELVARNPRLLFWGRAMLDIKMLSAIIVLFYECRGLDLKQVFWLSIIWSVAAVLTEIPSGILADRLGRKKTLILGSFFFLAFNVVLMFAPLFTGCTRLTGDGLKLSPFVFPVSA